MKSRHITRLRRLLLVVSLLAAVWALVVALTGGFVLESSMARLSSRSSRNPLIIAALSGLGAWALLPVGRRRSVMKALGMGAAGGVSRFLRLTARVPPQAAPLVAAVAAAAVTAIGFRQGALVAGGSDSYGYVSQAHLWTIGALSVDQPFTSQMTWPQANQSLAPLGYRLAPHGDALVPGYAPGLPMVMSIFERLGGRPAVFYVVPLLGGLAVWLTYLMGSRLAGRRVGVSAALLLATSPVFLYQLMLPMSDVPAAAWWALSLTLLPLDRRDGALVSGLAAAAAILTRPNIVPVVVVPVVFLVWRILAERSLAGRATERAVLFGIGAVPALIVIALLNTRWYGSPFDSGYGTLDYLFDWKNLWPNVSHYGLWLLETHTPIVLVALGAPFLVSARTDDRSRADSQALAITWLAFVLTTLACYVFYFQVDAWWYLRFLLPALPALLVLTSVGIVWVASPLGPGAREAALAIVLVLLGWHGVRFAIDHGAFTLKEGERKYAAIGQHVASRLPERAVFICSQHSGSLRYYSGRLTVRYDWIPDAQLDHVISELRRLGYHPYLLLDNEEVTAFQERFKTDSQYAALDWPPTARLQHPSATAIYDPAERQAALEGRPRATEIVH